MNAKETDAKRTDHDVDLTIDSISMTAITNTITKTKKNKVVVDGGFLFI